MGMMLRRYHEPAGEVIEGVPEQDSFDAEPPAGNASKADWLAYALTQGYTDEGLEGRTRDEIRALINEE